MLKKSRLVQKEYRCDLLFLTYGQFPRICNRYILYGGAYFRNFICSIFKALLNEFETVLRRLNDI